MKHLHKIPISLLLFVLLGLIHCGPPDPPAPVLTELEKLPPPTQEGLNTIGFLANGKAFKSSSPGAIVVGNNYLRLESEEFWLYKSYKGIDLYFEIYDEPLQERVFHLNDSSFRTEVLEYIRCYSSDERCSIDERYRGNGYVKLDDYDTDRIAYSDGINGTGTLEITRFDTISFILSGTFEFTLSHPSGVVYKVTDGRFDLKYHP